ncbi:DgaE family pyridoxal phosphate-dependent ammonia lyase [soil metagenome]
MVDTKPATTRQQAEGVYDRLGVRTIINASGATTAVGGSLMPEEVALAMIEASKSFVSITELNAAVGRKIAEATGAEAGYVTAGSAAGMLLSVAACITGTDPVKINRLPDSHGMANEVIIHRVHRINYDIMFRAAGGKLVEIGIPRGTDVWELENAITEKTACIAYIDSPSTAWGALEFETVVEIARKHDVPVIVDAASTLPPLDHLRRWIRWGADLVIYSGGKGIRGPQDSGLLAGRADLIAAAAANGNPHRAVGRAAKVSKESMVGLAVALDRFLGHDHDADFAEHRHQAEVMQRALSGRDDVQMTLTADAEAYPAPVLMLIPAEGTAWTPDKLRQALQESEPPIYCRLEQGRLELNTHCLMPGEAEQIAEVLTATLDRWKG